MYNLFGERLRSRREMVIRSAENATADAATAAATSAATTTSGENALTPETSTLLAS